MAEANQIAVVDDTEALLGQLHPVGNLSQFEPFAGDVADRGAGSEQLARSNQIVGELPHEGRGLVHPRRGRGQI